MTRPAAALWPARISAGRGGMTALPSLVQVGLGTWQYNDTVAEAATSLALSLGYTHIDTAIGYGNQVELGGPHSSCHYSLTAAYSCHYAALRALLYTRFIPGEAY